MKTRTLTMLYNRWPEWLAHAHRVLHKAVFAAHGWSADVSRADVSIQEILSRLLALNHERAAPQSG